MTYEFRTAQGRVCCKGNDFRLLCDSCKAKAAMISQETTATGSAPPAESQN
jgi:hypothetical protein